MAVTLKFPYQEDPFTNVSVLRFENQSGEQTMLFQEHSEVINDQSLTKAIYQDTLVEFRGDLQTPDLQKLHDGVFSYRLALKKVTLPASVMKVGDEAFMNSPNLRMVKFMGPVPEFGEDVFTGTSDDLEIYVPTEYESGYRNALSDLVNRIETY